MEKGLIFCLLHRADIVCSNDKLLQAEHAKLRRVFFDNGYSNRVFDNIKHQYENNKRKLTVNTTKTDREENKIWVKVPYVGKLSRTFGRKIKELLEKSGQKVQAVYKTKKVMESFILKDRAPNEMASKVVYQFTCR